MVKCRSKMRFATREIAQTYLDENRHRLDGQQLHVYYCELHAAFHFGRSNGMAWHWKPDADTLAVGLLQRARQEATAAFGKDRNPEDWMGVRVLTRTIRHLMELIAR